MSLASLAAYASSDDEDDVDNDCAASVLSTASVPSAAPLPSAASSSSAALAGRPGTRQPLRSTVDLIKDGNSGSVAAVNLIEDEENERVVAGPVTASLPRAVEDDGAVSGSVFQADDVVDDVPLADRLHAEKPRKSQTVKIAIPSLAQFKNDEDGEPAAKQMKPSMKGSGLFSLLPPPKSMSTKRTSRPLLPQTLSRPVAARSAAPASARPSARSSTRPVTPDSDDEQDCGDGADFFSLTSEPSVLPPPADVAGPLTYAERVCAEEEQQQQQQEETAAAAAAAESYQMDTSDHDEAALQRTEKAPLDAQAMQQLSGRRHQADIHIIDISQDDILPDRDEWLTKTLTEEAPVRRPQKSADDPTQQQRRKHQITYLAHQAKEREVELKNEWAQNRATKNAYRTKYGF